MSFDPLRHRPRARKVAPWIVYGVVAAAVAALAPSLGGSTSPGSVDVSQASVNAPRSARVLKLHVRPGDVVQAGEVVAELDPSGVDLELAIAQADLETLRVKGIAEQLDLRGSDLESSARLAQEAERAAVDLAALVSEERRDRAELAQLDEQIAKQEQLVAQKLASAEQRDQLRLQRSSVAQRVAEYGLLLKAARAHEAAAKERLRAWRAAKEKAGTPAGADAVPLDERTAPGLAEANAQQRRVDQLRLMRDQLKLAAPIAGRVSEVLFDVGDTARAGEPVLIIVEDDPSRVVAWVDERKAHGIRVGERVSLRASDGSGGAREGVVDALAPSIAEMPERFRQIPTQPQFGRAVYITLTKRAGGVAAPLPGQAFNVTFTGQTLASTTATAAAPGPVGAGGGR